MLQPGGRALCLCCSADEIGHILKCGLPHLQARLSDYPLHPGKAVGQSLYLGFWNDRDWYAGVFHAKSGVCAGYLLVRKRQPGFCLFVPRIYGAHTILSVLRTATEAAARGQSPAQAVLSHAPEVLSVFRWEKRGVYNRPV